MSVGGIFLEVHAMTLALLFSVDPHLSQHPWAVRAVFLCLIILFALLWAVKNKFTDYP